MATIFYRSVAIILVCITLFYNCTSKNQTTYSPPTPSNLSGEELAKTYCGSCHLFPSPDLLDKKTWETGVLPQMKLRMGLGDSFSSMAKLSEEEIKEVLVAGVYPEHPMIAEQDWEKITKFYLENAPENLALSTNENISKPNNWFEIQSILSIKDEFPLTTLVKFNPNEKLIYIGNRKNQIEIFDLENQKVDSIQVKSPPSAISFESGKKHILCLGIMDPSNQKKGQYLIDNQVIMDSLRRPVDFTFGDLNQDKIQDFVLCSYGNDLGKLAWYDGKTKKEHILKPIAGARNAIIIDLNHDHLPDIVALMAQSREGVFAFFNKGKGEFEEQTLLEYPPVYGSSFFELADFNNDGFQDILYTNGDNADYSISLKGFHGIRIFLNDGKNHFKQSFFLPMHGASKAQSTDFDGDGDLDIAAIAFFPEKLSEGFVLLENQGNLTFKGSTIKQANQGKWLVMDVADMDSDGDKDIILGSFIRNSNENFVRRPKALILKNRTVR